MSSELTLFQELNTQENPTVNNYLQLKCYQGLPIEAVDKLEGYVADAKRIINKASFDLAEKFCDARDVYRHNKHGGFEGWIEERFKISRQTAYKMIWRYEQFGTVDNIEQLDIALSAQYSLSLPGTPQEARDEAIQRAEDGEKITVKASDEIIERHKAELEEAKKANEDLQRDFDLFKQEVETNEQAHTTLVQSLEQKLEEKPEPVKVIEYQDTLETAAKVAELETLIELLEGKPTIPPETQTELDKLHLELKNAQTELDFYTTQNAALAEENKRRNEESGRTLADATALAGYLRTRQEWQYATGEMQANLRKFHTRVPSEIDRESFEGEEHTRTAQTIEVLEQTIAILKKTLPHSGDTLGQADIVDAELFPMPVIHEAKRPVIGIPPEYKALFDEYEQVILNCPEDELVLGQILWSAPNHGYTNQFMEREKHIQFTKELLSSEVDRRVRAALEAMQCTLGEWEG